MPTRLVVQRQTNKNWTRDEDQQDLLRKGWGAGLTHSRNQHQPILRLERLDDKDTGVAAQGDGNNSNADKSDIGHGEVEAAIRRGVGRGYVHIWEFRLLEGRAVPNHTMGGDCLCEERRMGNQRGNEKKGRGGRGGGRELARAPKITRRETVGWPRGSECTTNACAVNIAL